MSSNLPSRRAVLKAAGGLTFAAGVTALSGNAAAASGRVARSAAQATISNKVTFWDATSVAGPTAARPMRLPIIAWRGNANSFNLTVATLVLDQGNYAFVQKKILTVGSEYAPAFLPYLSGSGAAQLAWTDIGGGQPVNVANLGMNSLGMLDGTVTGRTVVAGDTVRGTTGPAWSQNGASRVVVADQSGNAVVAQETGELTFAPPVTLGFAAGARGPVRSWETGDGGTLWYWTAADASLSFAVTNPAVNGGAPTLATSEQASPFEPSALTESGSGGVIYLAWVKPDGSGLINIASVNILLVMQGADPLGPIITLSEQSAAAPALLPHPGASADSPALEMFWTGTDGAGSLNAAVVNL